MAKIYSLDSLAQFVKEERDQLEKLGFSEEQNGPSESSIQKILGFSRQLSVRTSKTLGYYEQNLN